MKCLRSVIGFILCVPALLITAHGLIAQPSQTAADRSIRDRRPVVTVSFANGTSFITSAEGGMSDLVGLQPREVVNLQLRFPALAAGRRIVVQSLDGGFAKSLGNVSAPDANGTLNLTFQAGDDPGLNRILVLNQGTSCILRFWVINNANPSANPRQLH